MNEKSKDMDEKSTRNPEKVKDVEDVTIERSIGMRKGAKTKYMKSSWFEKRLKSKGNKS